MHGDGPTLCLPGEAAIGYLLCGKRNPLLRRLCWGRHGLWPILERHWLLDRGPVHLGMDLDTGGPVEEGVQHMRFRARIELHGKTATGIVVPSEVVEYLKSGKRPPVRVTINGHTYRSTVVPMEGEFRLPISVPDTTIKRTSLVWLRYAEQFPHGRQCVWRWERAPSIYCRACGDNLHWLEKRVLVGPCSGNPHNAMES